MDWRQRAKYSNRNIRTFNRFENAFVPLVFDDLKKFFDQFAETLRLRGIDAVRTKLSVTLIDTSMGDIIRKIYQIVGIHYANLAYKEIQASAQGRNKAGQIGFSDQWAKDINDYFRMYLIDKAVVPITKQSKAQIMAVLEFGTREGWSIERMAKELEQPLLLMWRARLIVRTETAKAAFYGRRLGEQYSEFEVEKEWISAHDFRTRHGHREVDGQVIDNNARFAVPVYNHKNVLVRTEMMIGPGDPDASAENVCNCRCTTASKAKRDANGRIMRRPMSRVSVIRPNEMNRPTTTILI